MAKKYWEIKASAENSVDVFLYGEIVPDGWQWEETDTAAIDFKKALDEAGNVQTINLHVNSPGGSVYEGLAIHNMLKQHKAKVTAFIDGMAASIASLIVMAADTIYMPSNAMMMVHSPLRSIYGHANDLREAADMLDKTGESMKQSYLHHGGEKLTVDKITELFSKDSWLSAQDCFDIGLADEIEEPVQMAACVSRQWLSKFKNVPAALLKAVGGGDPAHRAGPTPQQQNVINQARQQIAEQAKAGSAYVDTILGGMM